MYLKEGGVLCEIDHKVNLVKRESFFIKMKMLFCFC